MMGFNRLVLLIIFCTLSWQVSAQLSGILEDSTTSEPIPYVNIWIENEMTGTTADERGGFSLTYKQREDGVIVFSAIGFKTKKVIAANIGKVVLLKPEVTHLKEVVVRGEKRNRKLHVEN